MVNADELLQPIVVLWLDIRHLRHGRLEFRSITPARA
jgi:hypothetical protein